MNTIYKIAGILLVLIVACSCGEATTKTNLPDRIIWYFPPTDFNTRMFYGPIKKSEEIMYYATKDANGQIVKVDKKYYETGRIFPHNFSIEFDSLGRRSRFISYLAKAGKSNRGGPINEDQYGFIYYYNENNQEIKSKTIYKTSKLNWYSTASLEIFYNNKKYNISRRVIQYDIDGKNRWTNDSSAFKYNEKGLMIDSEFYMRDSEDDPLIQERAFGEEPITYAYDDQGRVVKKTRKKGGTHHYFYKDSVLYRETRELFGRTNEYIYYPNGVYKSAKLRTTLITGDFEFLETGDITTYNGQKVADYYEFDAYGNWTKRIRYKENGEPQSYTERKIEYYK
ncbi:RHS repeat protein [Aquimarina muelleri]|uniref:YD repeat-containing protein n=1 Tax=Aquimarina muelleri TaxID=279356 RepID=A0A918N596_9FLAO|nr:RHS repeat protein [Aquimarina muelleri]MCX2764830.1 RHS repeat protein [Aquimarina muelleri]GGX27955.1 hypothetical protein GCM10007384_31490 [Aquimarina muelleri]